MMDLNTFLQRVEYEPNTGCWLWNGAPGAGGYGVIRFDGRYQKAHRVSWALHNGLMPGRDIKVCHSCDTPACVNPDHLWLGTQLDNIADMVAKGRNRTGTPRFGTANAGARLSEPAVAEIRQILEWDRWTQKEIAKSYGVSQMTVSRIANWQMWPRIHKGWPLHPLPIYATQEPAQ